MDTADLIPPSFWQEEGTYIATAPGREAEAGGLANFAHDKLGTHGWCFFQTSGSDGAQKWVGLTRKSLLVSAECVNTHYGIGRQDRWLLALPLHHVGGFSICARAFLNGTPVERLNGHWDATAFADRCKTKGATLTSLVPAQVYDLVSAGLEAPQGLRAVIVGGGALPNEIAVKARALGWRVLRTYGMTEAGSQVAAQDCHGYSDVLEEAMEVLPIWRASTDSESVLTIRGEALARGYAVRGTDATWSWEPIDPEAGLRTRDRVSLWMHGTRQYLQFLGRESAHVKILGELANIDELQRKLDQAAAQRNFAGRIVLLPLPDPRRETRLVLAVSPAPADEAALRDVIDSYHAQCRAFEKIDRWVALPELPLSDLGKVRMPALRQMVESQLQ